MGYPTPSHAVEAVIDEMQGARNKHGDISSLHEGYAVILEEVEAFWDQVRKGGPFSGERDDDRVARELVQIAAMAIRTLVDCGYEERAYLASPYTR